MLTLLRPDDFHVHLRDGVELQAVARYSAERFGRVLVMPNLEPPIRTAAQVIAYRERIIKAAAAPGFEPLMTIMLTEDTTQDQLREAREHIHGVKYYPDKSGPFPPRRTVLATLEELDIPLLLHAEATYGDIFSREALFIDLLGEVVDRYPKLRVVLEHISTAEAVDFVLQAREGVAATITAHHLMWNRGDMLAGALRPHLYCAPVLKTETDRLALLRAATSGNHKFFLGTYSAPHSRTDKESPCCPAGIFTAHAAIELYAEKFADAQALHRLEGFASRFGCAFYKLPLPTQTITLQQKPWRVPLELPFGAGKLRPALAGQLVHWRIRQPEACRGIRREP